MKKGLKFQLFDAVGVNKEKQSVKMTEAPTIKTKEKGKFMVFKKNAVVQADLIYMRPDPGGYKYILTVVDVATRAMDCIALKGRESMDVIEGFEQIWKHKYITKDIQILYTDPGTEFKNKQFHEYMEEKRIVVRHTMTARKGQMGVVEYFNHLITNTVGTKMTSEELETGEEYNAWAEMLPKIVKVLNNKENLKTPNLSDFFKEPRTTLKEVNDRLAVGTVVHVRLQAPKDHLADTNNKLTGGFRNGDVRWEKAVTEIDNVIMLPNQPIRYMVKKYNNVSFMRKELLLADETTTQQHRTNNPNIPPEPPAPKVPINLETHKGPVTRAMAKKTGTVLVFQKKTR
jgi:transposase InsO family protein